MDTARDELVATGDAEADAKAMLTQIWNLGAFTPIPIDPIQIARDIGLAVYTARLEPGVGGMLVSQPGKQVTIYLNADDHRNRQRFTCAHELGHWMKRQGRGVDWAFVDRRDALAGKGVDPNERYANGFAAALLMPDAEVDKLIQAHLSAKQMAEHFNVSLQALNIRLANLGLTAQ